MRRGRIPATRRRALAVATLLLACAGATGVAQGAAPPGFVGIVSPDTFAGTPTYQSTELAAMRASGVTVLRQVFDWSIVEAKPGTFDFTPYNAFVAAAARHGIAVMPILFNPPLYLSARPSGSNRHGTYPPEDPASISPFAAAAVRWYGPKGGFWKANPTVPRMPIRIWQVWDEPNLPVYWLPKPNAEQYVSLLKDSYKAIHALDPGAEVVSAGIPQSKLGVELFSYLRSLLHAGAARWMNTLGINAYSKTAPAMIKLLRRIRTVLDVGGGQHVALRVTEFGWANIGPDGRFSLTTAGQATQVGHVISDFGAVRSQLDLRGFVYFDWRDAKPYPGGHDFWGLHTGLLNLNGTAKPSLRAFGRAANAL